jgi:glucose-1-phosphate cytidylyltransferase
VKDEEAFCLTYGDGVGDIDITRLIALHQEEGRLVTVTASQQPGRFGALRLEGNRVTAFREKSDGDGGWINGGFFVCSPRSVAYIEGDLISWEREPLEAIARQGQLSVHRHEGFWQPMDTLHDKNLLDQLWRSGKAPWKVW